MDNRDRDKVSRNTTSTSAGDVNRSTSERIGKEKSDSSAEFGEKIGRSENLHEPSGRNSGSGSMGSSSSNSSGSSGRTDSESSGWNSSSSDRGNSSGSSGYGSGSGRNSGSGSSGASGDTSGSRH